MTPKFKTGQEVWTQIDIVNRGFETNTIADLKIMLIVQDICTKKYWYFTQREEIPLKILEESFLFKTKEEAKNFFDNLININRIR